MATATVTLGTDAIMINGHIYVPEDEAKQLRHVHAAAARLVQADLALDAAGSVLGRITALSDALAGLQKAVLEHQHWRLMAGRKLLGS